MEQNLDFQGIIEEIYTETLPLVGQGAVADYIPALAAVDKNVYGIAIQTLAGESYQIGDSQVGFSIQSISKVYLLSMVFAQLGEKLWKRMGYEPSGSSFNSLVRLEYEQGLPRNPFINAGALVLADCLISYDKTPLESIIQFVRKVADNPHITFDSGIVQSELSTAHRNTALAYFMKSFGNIHNDVFDILDVYCHQCGLMMNCVDLAKSFLYLASGGVNPFNNERLLTSSQAKRINAVMQTCGFYDESGQFAFTVGLPGKSGVGGGIVAVIPNLLTICVWSPGLNKCGNSVVGMKALELFTTRTGISIF